MPANRKIQSTEERNRIVVETANEWALLSKEEKKALSADFVREFKARNNETLKEMSEDAQKEYIHNNCRPREEYIREVTGSNLSDGTIRRILRANKTQGKPE